MDRILDIPIIIGFALGGSGGDGADAWIGLWGGLIGAFVGAGVSGAISLYLQMREHNRANALRGADALLRQRSVGHRILVKLIALHSDFVKIQEHLHQEFEKQPLMPDAEPWQYVMPLFVPAAVIEFDGEETALFLDMEMNDAFNAASALPRIHNHVTHVLREYALKREQLRAMLPPECFGEDDLILDEQQRLWTAPLRAEMNDLITWAYGSCDQDASESREALLKTYEAMKTPLSLKMDIGFKYDQPSEPGGAS